MTSAPTKKRSRRWLRLRPHLEGRLEMFTRLMREAATIMRDRRPETMGGIFECAKADGKDDGEAWAIVDSHFANFQNQDYRAAAGLKVEP